MIPRRTRRVVPRSDKDSDPKKHKPPPSSANAEVALRLRREFQRAIMVCPTIPKACGKSDAHTTANASPEQLSDSAFEVKLPMFCDSHQSLANWLGGHGKLKTEKQSISTKQVPALMGQLAPYLGNDVRVRLLACATSKLVIAFFGRECWMQDSPCFVNKASRAPWAKRYPTARHLAADPDFRKLLPARERGSKKGRRRRRRAPRK